MLERLKKTNGEQITSLKSELDALRDMLASTASERDKVIEQRDAKQLAHESEVSLPVFSYSNNNCTDLN